MPVLGLLLLAPLPKAAAAPLPYGQAVSFADRASQAVLSRAGRETCLRGKLTKALLQLSDSCQAQGLRNGLCAFADQALVVTPMSLSFMDDTSRQLLQLIKAQGSQGGASATTGPAAVPAGSMPVSKLP